MNYYKQPIFRDFGSILGTKRIEAYFKNIFGVYKTHFIEHELTLGKNEILPLMEKLGTFITIACIIDITRQPANFSPNYKYFDQLLPTVKNETTVLRFVFKDFLTNINYH